MAVVPHSESDRLIRAVPLLARLSDVDTRALARKGQARSYGGGQVVFGEGEPGDALHVIIEGEVLVTVLSGAGEEATLARFGPGDCFGELALLDGLPRSGTATATRPTRSFVVSRDDFLAWLRERPGAALALLETVSRRLRRTSEQMTDRLFLGLQQRLVKELLESAEPAASGRARVVNRTQVDLGAALGVSRESVNKTLRSLEREGVVELGRGRVRIPDVLALRPYL